MTKKRLDPLGQSFFVQSPTVVTKVDLYFASKDDSLPVFLRLRKNKDGAPSTEVVPFSEKLIPAANVLVSANANVATTVSFDSPILLDTGEYSITLGSDSKDYKVWVSQLGDRDTTTDRQITEQPLLGSLFKSQNASTWDPTQLEDLKFTLYRAKFDTNVTAQINLTPVSTYQSYVFESDSLEVYPSSPILKVFQYNHGLLNNSYVKIKKLANANVMGNIGNIFGISGNLIEGQNFIVSNVKTDSYTIILPSPVVGVTEPTRFGKNAVISNDVLYQSITPTIAIQELSNTSTSHKIITTTPSVSSYVVDSSFSNINNREENKLNSTRVLTSEVNRNLKLSNVNSLQYQIQLTTNDDYVSPMIDVKQAGLILKNNLINDETYDNSVFAHEISRVANANVSITALSNTVGVITLASASDQANAKAIIKGTILTLTANINSGQYRVMDVLSNGANIKITKLSGSIITDTAGSNVYTITNSPVFIAEEAASGGSAYSKYITRQVDFVNPSSSIKFFVDVSKPANGSLEFYYKTKLAGDNTNLKDVEYTKIDSVTIPTSQSGEFYEVSKQVDNIPGFTSLVLKIVFKAADGANSPIIKNLRIVALE